MTLWAQSIILHVYGSPMYLGEGEGWPALLPIVHDMISLAEDLVLFFLALVTNFVPYSRHSFKNGLVFVVLFGHGLLVCSRLKMDGGMARYWEYRNPVSYEGGTIFT